MLIDQEENMLWHSFLNDGIVGAIEFEALVSPRGDLVPTGVEFKQSAIIGFNVQSGEVTLEAETLHADNIIIALGARELYHF